MEALTQFVNAINGIVWGPPMLVAILGTGLFLQLRLKLMPLLKIGLGFKWVFKSRNPEAGAKGDITPYAALMTALAATVGTGNIAGVATAIALGGPGALFWMWMTALVGMATKYAEVLLAVHYRETDARGQQVGGPMYAIKNGLGKNWKWLGMAFALFGGLAGFGIGNMVQSNSVADVLNVTFGIDKWLSGIVMTVLVGFVLIGGVKRIGAVAQKIVPFMCVLYIITSLIVLGIYIQEIPAAFALIIESAFNPVAATGGFAGAAIMLAIRYGVARGIFSNEAGLGTAGIAIDHISATGRDVVDPYVRITHDHVCQAVAVEIADHIDVHVVSSGGRAVDDEATVARTNSTQVDRCAIGLPEDHIGGICAVVEDDVVHTVAIDVTG